MQVQTSQGLVLGYDTYSKPTDQGDYRVAWGKDDDAPLVEYVSMVFDGEMEPRRITLDKSINGERAGVHALVSLTCEVVPATIDGIYRVDKRSGQYVPTTRQKDKWRCVGMQTIKEAPAQKAA